MKRFFDQPQVIGEMIAGVILGPSLLGLLAPDVQAMIFPKDAKPVLYVCAQLGVGLYMFLVGLGPCSSLCMVEKRGRLASLASLMRQTITRT
ncbi:cation:proton antiporter domain-containing protein [Sphingomonas faeni]|uniref:cation:proton antiporter domain-containing protein n=1 Tax=Sphingomonas faeni TaxID=185950 RepID=UPI0032C06D56